MAATLLWVRSNLRSHWRSAALVVLIAGLCAGAAMAAVGGARRTTTAFTRFVDDSKDPQVFVVSGDREAAETAADVIRGLVDPARVGEAVVFAAKPATLDRSQEIDFQVIGVRSASVTQNFLVPRVLAGHLPTGPDEVAFNEIAANILGVRSGDSVPMLGYSNERLGECQSGGDCTADVDLGEVTVSAITRSPSDITPEATGSATIELSPLVTTSWLPRVAGTLWAVLARLEPGDSGTTISTALVDTFGADRIEGASADVFVETASDGDADRTSDALHMERSGLLILALLAGVSGFVAVPQALTRQQSAVRSDEDRLQALGFTRRQHLETVGLSSLIIGVASALAGVVLAVLASPLFPIGLARRAEPSPGVHADWLVLGLGGLAVVLFVLGTGLISARFRSTRPAATRPSRVGRLFTVSRPVPATAGRFLLDRERLSSIARTSLTASVLGVAVIVGAATVLRSEDHLVVTPSLYGAPWDLQGALLTEDMSALQTLVVNPLIEAAAAATGGRIEVGGIEVGAVGLKPVKGLITPTLFEGRTMVTDGEIVLSPDVMGQLRLQVGDTIRAGTGGHERDFTVVGRGLPIENGSYATTSGATLGWDDFAEYAFVNDIQNENSTDLLVRAVPGADLAAVRAEIAPFTNGYDREMATSFRPARILNLDRVRTVPQLIVVFTALLTLLVVAHSLAIVASRRRGDLAVLRALGMRARDARRVLWWHGGFLAAIAIIVGIPLGVIGGRLLWHLIAESLQAISVPRFPSAAIVAVTVGLILFSVAEGAALARRGVPRSLVKILRSE